MVWGAKQDTIDKNPELVKLMMDIHRKATEYAMSNDSAKVEMAVQKLGQTRKSIELASPNVELTWKIDAEFIKRAKAYAQLMHEKKQIRELPNFDKFITTKFMPTAVAAVRSRALARRRPQQPRSRSGREPGSELRRAAPAPAPRRRRPRRAARRRRRAAPRRRVLPERVQSLLLGIGFPIALVILWHQLVVMTGTRLVPTPYQVGLMMYDFAFGGIHDDAFSGTILTHLLASMERVYGGFALAVVLGVPLGLAHRQGQSHPAARSTRRCRCCGRSR